MSAHAPQVVDSEALIPICEYKFLGNSGTVSNKRAFVDAYRSEGSIYHAVQVVGVGRTTVYRWLEQDAEFAQAVADSHEDSVDMAETSAFKKALAGDSLLLMFYLKAHRPKFRDKVMIDVNAVQEEIRDRIGSSGQLAALLPATTTSDDNQ